MKPHGSPLPDGKRKYGWVPDVPDYRDKVLTVARMKLPTRVDLTPGFPEPCFDQGELGSCTANAAAGVVQFDLHKQNLPLVMPSRLFVYYAERVIEGTVDSDSGATIRDSVKALNKGYCREDLWPYKVDRFADKPSKAAYADAKGRKCLKYQRVTRSPAAMKGCLAKGLPFLIGFTVYESFESGAVAKTGKAQMPRASDAVLGGHAVVCCGYDDAEGRFRLRNSWGSEWGDGGYFTLPYGYLADVNLSDDFWCVTVVK